MPQTTAPLIDTHHHFWRLSRGGYGWMPDDVPALNRDYEPEDLHPILARKGITGTIAVQADDNVAETEFLLSLARDTPWILGVVGWVDLAQNTGLDDLNRLAAVPHFIGVRPMIQDIPDDHWMLRAVPDAAIAALVDHDLSFDALVLPRHLPILAEFATRHPALRIVVDHCAKPEIAAGRITDWARDIEAVAAHPNSFCKLSGLLTEAGPESNLEDLRPYLDHVVQCFGPDRVLFGSDWPVLNLAADYEDWIDMMAAYAEGNDTLDWGKMMSQNPLAAYPRLHADR